MTSNGLFYLLVLAVVTFSSLSLNYAQENVSALEAGGSDLFFVCKRDKNIRWLRAYKMENGKCNTIYSKEGYLQVIGSATYFSSCEGVLHSVQKNLEEGGFKCNPITKFAVLELE